MPKSLILLQRVASEYEFLNTQWTPTFCEVNIVEDNYFLYMIKF
jgi:hypothetical protein